ncbi:MAG: DUF4838 domain-containing protein [Clostridia bacterium]|nr:DUF4838 domain-containing protein [Clostridia bacterium]
MKKGLLKTVSIILILAMLFSTGCNKGDKVDPDYSGLDLTPTEYSEKGMYTGGTHIYRKTVTNDFMISNGESDYYVVIPNDAGKQISFAASEISSLMNEATGVVLRTVKESELPVGAKYISLGNTSLAESTGISVPDTLNTNGFIIRTVNKNVYICAKHEFGVLWGTYELLTQTVGYKCVAYDAYVFDDVTDVPLYDFEITDNPDFEYRLSNTGKYYTNSDRAYKMRFALPHSDFYLAPSKPYHNFFYFIPETNRSVHPKWFSDDGTQLCLSAHGDEAERTLLVNAMVEALKKNIDADTSKKLITVTQMDGSTWCKCPTCASYRETYGTDAGLDVIFINEVAEKIENWLNTERNGREVVIAIFAYNKTETAPSRKNTDGTYSPIDEKVVCRDNVAVMYAPIFARFAYGLDQPENIQTQEIMKGWSACCKYFGYWGYCTNFSNYNTPYNVYGQTKGTYKLILENFSPIWMFDQGAYSTPNCSGFNDFKTYLQSRWGWDVNLDYNELKREFFDIYFGRASNVMEQMFDEIITQCQYIQDEYGSNTTIAEQTTDSRFWSLRQLETWYDYIEQAYRAIEIYADNAEKYQTYRDHICIESVFVRYTILKLYSSSLSSKEEAEMKQQLKEDCERLHITHLSEDSLISNFFRD